ITKVPFDVHLMIENPYKYIDEFIKAGADILTIHYESKSDIIKTLKEIKEKGCKASISIKPNTEPEVLFPYLELIDMLLIMTVEPGFGGQKLIPECLEKAQILKAEITKRKLNVLIEADGGITPENLTPVRESGVDIAVIGSAIFKSSNRNELIKILKERD
ncbi:MAG: ribulose-phosphate 3-epimerase, partial [Clostridia bacterium]|nr:ribulose-phosphate 3-epimerase [Clostridia bacterium]